ncbi:MAG: deoxyribodipyrimidine photolyase [Vicinamibacterales bacterium]
MTSAPRVRAVNDAPIASAGRYVLYWMIAARRARSNAALDRALAHARALGRPLVVVEALRAGYPWASDRLHQFVIDGMHDNARAFDRPGVRYVPYVEPVVGAGRGLLEALAAEAAVVVTDDFPAFFLPRMVTAAGARLPVRLEAVDGNGLLPMRAADRAFPTAFAFRRFLQRSLAAHLGATPDPEPFSAPLPFAPPALPDGIAERWPDLHTWMARGGRVERLPIDHGVTPTGERGGAAAAHARLEAFVADGLPRYADDRNDAEHEAVSRLSPYLHFGHLSAHDVFAAVMAREGWLGVVPRGGLGARAGWWGVSAAAEAYLDQLVTWRELGFNGCVHRADYDRYESLPAWAMATLSRHASDPRDVVYPHRAFDEAATHDPLWNAAQRQLRREGRIHNYLRMLWGKKILEWSATPQDALATMIDLNNRYALDGRDPNSYSGIFWILGRYDRPWGPERAVFGTVRYMSSDNTARKLRVKAYLARYADQPSLLAPV